VGARITYTNPPKESKGQMKTQKESNQEDKVGVDVEKEKVNGRERLNKKLKGA